MGRERPSTAVSGSSCATTYCRPRRFILLQQQLSECSGARCPEPPSNTASRGADASASVPLSTVRSTCSTGLRSSFPSGKYLPSCTSTTARSRSRSEAIPAAANLVDIAVSVSWRLYARLFPLSPAAPTTATTGRRKPDRVVKHDDGKGHWVYIYAGRPRQFSDELRFSHVGTSNILIIQGVNLAVHQTAVLCSINN